MIQSIKHALRGIVFTFRTERNFRIQIAVALAAVAAGIYFYISAVEWMFLSSAIFRVLSYESINTSVENLSEVCEKKRDIDIKNIKDTSAAYVLLSAIYALTIGGIIFVPKLLQLG